MNLLVVLIPDTSILISIVLGVLAIGFAGLLTFVLIYRKKYLSGELEEHKKAKAEQAIAKTAYAKREIVPTEEPEGKLEKTYAPLFADEFRGNYEADYYVTKVHPKDIDSSSDIYKVDEEKIAAALENSDVKKPKKSAPQIQTVGVANKFIINNAIAEAEEAAAKSASAKAADTKTADTKANTKAADTKAADTKATSSAASVAADTAADAAAEKQAVDTKSGKSVDTKAADKAAAKAADTNVAANVIDTANTDRSKDKVLSYDGENAVVIRGNNLFHIQYLKSYSAKLIQADREQKKYYSDIKNELIAYGLKPRTSWKAESFRLGRKKFAIIVMRGKTMCLLLNLDPKAYAGTKYKVEDMSETGWLKDTPTLYRLKNPRRAKYALDLINEALKDLSRKDTTYIDYSDMPYKTTEQLIAERLIKLVEHIQPVTPTQANVAMTDDVAKALIEEGDLSDRKKVEIINIDILSEKFVSGEKVTLAEIKKRIPTFNKKATALKVLARGSLDKSLTVEADDFSIEAVKMIALTGGKVIKKRRNR